MRETNNNDDKTNTSIMEKNGLAQCNESDRMSVANWLESPLHFIALDVAILGCFCLDHALYIFFILIWQFHRYFIEIVFTYNWIVSSRSNSNYENENRFTEAYLIILVQHASNCKNCEFNRMVCKRAKEWKSKNIYWEKKKSMKNKAYVTCKWEQFMNGRADVHYQRIKIPELKL